MSAHLLPAPLVERILEKLGFSHRPSPSLGALTALYGAWCEKVPFDNVRKLLHLAAGKTTPFPGDDAADFFRAWLALGTGGTCWAGSGALHALLVGLGFRAARGLGTLLVAPNVPPNHGTVIVTLDASLYMVDTSMLHGSPLLLDERATQVAHPAWGVRCGRHDGRWHVRWRPLHIPNDLQCSVYRLDQLACPRERFSELHERTRAWSPFNFEVYARINRAGRVVGFARGRRVELDAAGRLIRAQPSRKERTRLLVEELGISERVVSLLPADRPTPPPPSSRKARRLMAEDKDKWPLTETGRTANHAPHHG